MSRGHLGTVIVSLVSYDCPEYLRALDLRKNEGGGREDLCY